jgi:hypothetical protein
MRSASGKTILWLLIWVSPMTLASNWAPQTRDLAQSTSPDIARFLKGAIDLHLHVDPRPYGATLETLKLAHSIGMRGVVIKNHYEPSVDLAHFLRKEFPGFQIFGGIDQNWISGGYNVAAVEHMVEVESGKGGAGKGVIWFGTFDAAHQVRANKQTRPSLVLHRNGVLVPEVKQIIALIAKHNLVLASGHNSPDEALMLFREGRAAGVKNMIFTHPLDPPVHASVEQMKAAAELGAYIELDFRNTLQERRWEKLRAVGPEYCFLSEFWTKGPLGGNPPPYEYAGAAGFTSFITAMRGHGFTDRELDLLFKENPARALGL